MYLGRTVLIGDDGKCIAHRYDGEASPDREALKGLQEWEEGPQGPPFLGELHRERRIHVVNVRDPKKQFYAPGNKDGFLHGVYQLIRFMALAPHHPQNGKCEDGVAEELAGGDSRTDIL